MGTLDQPLRLLRTGAGLLAGTLRLGAGGLRELAHLVEAVTGAASPDGRRGLAGARLPMDRRVPAADERAARGPEPSAETAPGAPTEHPPGASSEAAPGVRSEAAGARRAAESPTERRPRALPGAATLRRRGPRGAGPPAGEAAAAREHVRVEEELVAELADSGAEKGAGAEVRVQQPWPGYDAMRARDVLDRLASEPPEVLSVVLLHEQANRRRRTVLEAARRALASRQASPRRPA